MLLHTHVYIINGEKAMNSKDRKEKYMGWVGGRRGKEKMMNYTTISTIKDIIKKEVCG